MEQNILDFVEQFKYVGIIVASFIEGPMIGLFTGFLGRIEYISLPLGYLATVLGDLIGDFFYFFLGYKNIDRFTGRFGRGARNMMQIKKVQNLLQNHPNKVILFGKLTHLFAFPTLIAIGLHHYSWKKFLLVDAIATLIKSAILVGLGFYLTHLWTQANNIIGYIGIIGFILILGFIGLVIYKEINEDIAELSEEDDPPAVTK